MSASAPVKCDPVFRTATLEDAGVIVDYNIRTVSGTRIPPLDASIALDGVKEVISRVERGKYYLMELDNTIVAKLRVQYEWLPFLNGYAHWFVTIYVHSDHRRKRYLGQIFNHAKKEAIKDGAVAVRLYTDIEDNYVNEAYRKFGMKHKCNIHSMSIKN